jgi:acyl-homoserine lactone acylase PvdQ
MTQEALKKMYQLLLTEPHAPTVCAQLERIAREALAEHAMRETQRLGQEIEQEPVAWMDADGNVSDNNDHKCFPIPLYTKEQP